MRRGAFFPTPDCSGIDGHERGKFFARQTHPLSDRFYVDLFHGINRYHANIAVARAILLWYALLQMQGRFPVTLTEIRPLAEAYFAAREDQRAHFRTKPDRFDLDNEDHIRWQIKYDRLINKHVRLETPYRAACDAFFAMAETSEAA